MVMRRLLGGVVATALVLLAGATPALADDGHGTRGWHGRPTYPPSAPSIWITRTQVTVGGTAVVKASGCQPKTPATVSVTGGATTQVLTVRTNGVGLVSTPVTFGGPAGSTQTVTVACSTPSGLSQSVTVSVVQRAGEPGRDDTTTSGVERGSKHGSDPARILSLTTVSSTSPLAGNAVPVALLAGVALLLGTGSGLLFTARRRRPPRRAHAR